jgi:hypothetical protein
MPELPAYPTDAAICRLLAGGPLPTAAIAARLAMPERTARHRLHQLGRWGLVVTGPDGRSHRLAGASPPALAAATTGLAATGDGSAAAIAPDGNRTDGRNRAAAALPGGQWTVLAVHAAVGIGAVVIRRRPPVQPPPPVVDPGDWGRPWSGW